jgi:hypothetical protein
MDDTDLFDDNLSEAPKAKRGRAKAPVIEAVKEAKKKVKILVEENDDIPPTGLPIGHNGTAYVIKPGEPVEVPQFILDILDNAVMSVPVTDPATKQVVGYRERLRYSYRRL